MEIKMKPNWENILQRLNKYPTGTHLFLPPCPEQRIESVQSELGKMPSVLTEMLKHFNGARLFKKTGPFVSIFGVSTIPLLPPLQWATEWYVNKFTPAWRSGGNNRQSEWAIAMMNYGGLVILEDHGIVKEWDTAQAKWNSHTWKINEWLEDLLAKGDAFLRES
jgi:hypothetical protein